LTQTKTCSPTCQFFKCTKNSAFYRRDTIWCRWTEEMCNIANCTYTICVRRRLLPRGICGETVKRKTVERAPRPCAPKFRYARRIPRGILLLRDSKGKNGERVLKQEQILPQGATRTESTNVFPLSPSSLSTIIAIYRKLLE
jgi:hypothetical protein